MRASLFALLMVACGFDRTGDSALLIGPDLAMRASCTGCPCCCARSIDAGHDRESDAGSLPDPNIADCNACVRFSLSLGDGGDDRACNAVQ